jgi:uncharacterized coiled-coil DUF342 family protein
MRQKFHGDAGEDNISVDLHKALDPYISKIEGIRETLDSARNQTQFTEVSLEELRDGLDSMRKNIIQLKITMRDYKDIFDKILTGIRKSCQELNIAIGELNKKPLTRKYYNCIGNAQEYLEKILEIDW